MSTASPEFPSGDEPSINDAVHQIAMSVHSDLVREIGQATGEPAITSFEERLQQHRKNYPSILFGELAMHLADVDLPADATAPDRARGIVEALRRISTRPDLFESITNAPYSLELAAGLVPEPPKLEKDDIEPPVVREIREKIARNGYLDWSMLPQGQLIQLAYARTSMPKVGWFRKLPDAQATAVIKVAAISGRSWDVKLYKHWDRYEGFTDPTGTRKQPLAEVFELVAAESSDKNVADFSKLSDKYIKLGKVTLGTKLDIRHDFKRVCEEVPGYEPEITNSVLSSDLQLQQAYYGPNRQYPLFNVS